MRRHLVVVVVLSIAPVMIAAQSTPAFSVASVKPSADSATPAGMMPLVLPQPGRLTARNATLRALVKTAYGVEDFQIEGGPDWAGSQRFDIVATAPGSSAADQPLMLRSLLSERFGLRAHIVQRDMPVFALVRVRAGGASARAAQSGLLPPGATSTPSDNPPLMTAIEQQLGLKLERTRSPVSVVVIDAAAMPVGD
jgi:hypothetical protein